MFLCFKILFSIHKILPMTVLFFFESLLAGFLFLVLLFIPDIDALLHFSALDV